MIIDELNKKIADIEILANDKASTIESKVSDLTDGLLMVADAVDIIPEMVDEKITAITKKFSAIKDSVSKVKAQKGDSGRDGIDGLDGLNGRDGKDGSPDKPKDIADKLNTLENVIDPKVIKGSSEYVNRTDLNRTISTLENQTRFLIQSNANKGNGGGAVDSVNGETGVVNLTTDNVPEGTNKYLNSLLVDGTSITGNGLDTPLSANFTQTGKYMISGGASWSGIGLVYDVSFLTYFFNGNKTADPDSVTLAASDPTNPRLDAVVVDEAGVISVITGDPSSSPVEPAIPEDQLQVQFILVEAGSTTPTIATENIYLDDPTSGWTFSTYNTATPTTGSINFAGTNSPKQGIECIEASTDLRLGARFVRGTSFDAFQYTMLQVWVRFTGTAVATNKSLNVRFENSAGTLVANTVNLFNYGLQRGVLNTWQLVVVPLTAFGALPATVKGLKMIMAGGTVGVARQWDIDYMILTNGSVPFANVPTIAFYKDNVGIAAQSGLNLIEGTGVTITAVNDPTNQRVNYTIDASGGSPAGSDTQVQFNDAGTFGGDSWFTFDKTSGNFRAGNRFNKMYINVASQEAGFFTNGNGIGFETKIVTGTEKGFYVDPTFTDATYYMGNLAQTRIKVDDLAQTIAFTANGSTAYSSDIPLSIKVTVPSADLLAVVTGPTPYELIPAPGAGKFIDVISIVCNLNFNTTAYDFNNALRIGTNTTGSTTMGTDGGQLTISPSNIINASATKLSVVGSASAKKNVNTALYLNAGSATTVTTGDSDIDLYITYKIVTL